MGLRLQDYLVHTGVPISPADADGANWYVLIGKNSSKTITSTDISADAADNSLNIAGGGFDAIAFDAGEGLILAGFVAEAGNNSELARIESRTDTKIIISGVALVDCEAGDEVSLTQWETVRLSVYHLTSAWTTWLGAHAAPYTPDDSGDWPVVPDSVGEALDTQAEATTDHESRIDVIEADYTTAAALNAAIGAYVAAQDVEVLKGAIDCSANPNYPAADAGHVYRVSVAGKIGGGSGPNVRPGDRLECYVDSSAAGTHASIGANWIISETLIEGAYYVGGPDVAVADGGTGASTASDARANLGALGGSTGATDNALLRADGTGGSTAQATNIAVSDNDEISGYRGHINKQTGTTYTLQASDTGKIVELENATPITLTVAATLAVGFACTVAQTGAGQVTVVAGSGGTQRNRQTHTKLAGQWAEGTIYVRANSGGSAAEYVFAGDTAA